MWREFFYKSCQLLNIVLDSAKVNAAYLKLIFKAITRLVFFNTFYKLSFLIVAYIVSSITF